MYRFYFTLVFLSLIKIASSQQPEIQWARAFTSHNQSNYSIYSNGRSVAVDIQGSVFSAGLFMHNVDFDPGPGTFYLNGSTLSYSSIYISKLNATGDFLWAIHIPVTVEFGSIEIEVDKQGNVYVASDLRDTADMDPGPGVYMLNPIGGQGCFCSQI